MDEQDELYPELDEDFGAGTKRGEPGEDFGEDPEGFADTFATLFQLFPKVVLRLTGYYVVWCIASVVAVAATLWFLFSTGLFAADMGTQTTVRGSAGGVGFERTTRSGPSLPFGMMIVTGAVWGLIAGYFWAVLVKHIDNVYTGRISSIKEELSDGLGLFGGVLGAWLFKGIAVGAVVWAAVYLVPEVVEVMELEGDQEATVTLVATLGLLAMAAVVYILVHFVDKAVVVDGCQVMDAIGRAASVAKGVGNLFFMIAWGVLAVIMVGLFHWFVQNVVIGAMEEMFEGLVYIVAVLGTSVTAALVVVPFLLVVNYAVYRCLSSDQEYYGF